MPTHEDAFDRDTVRSALRDIYLAGRCTGFAVAVHRRTGWPLVALRGGSGELIHSGCRAPDGRYVDARGFLPEASFTTGFEWYRSIEDGSEERLLADHPQDEALIRTAALHAELLLDLPGESEHRRRFSTFASALRELCDSHGIWLRGPHPGPGGGIIAYEAYGDEAGFAVRMMPAGGAVLERRLGDEDPPEPDETPVPGM